MSGHERPELLVAALADGAEPALEIDAATLAASGATQDYVTRQLPEQLREIERRRVVYLQGRQPLPLEQRTAVLSITASQPAPQWVRRCDSWSMSWCACTRPLGSRRSGRTTGSFARLTTPRSSCS